MGLFQKAPFGELDEMHDEVVWRGKSNFPSEGDLAQLCEKLPLAKSSLTPKGNNITGRELRYLTGWVVAYAKSTISILNDEFETPEKSFEMILLRSNELSEINLVVRLMTAGVSGWSQYRIAWRKVENEGAELFFCRE